MRQWILLISLFVMVGSAFSSDVRRRNELAQREALATAQQKLEIVQKELDRIRINRWQDKRNVVAKKEAYQELWQDLRRSVEKMQRDQAAKEETFLRIESQVNAAKKELEEVQLRHKELGTLVSDKVMDLEKELKIGWPEGRDQALASMEGLQKSLANTEYRINEDHLDKLFSEQKREYLLGETNSIVRKEFPMLGLATSSSKASAQTTKMVAGYEIRVGAVYKAFISTEGEDAAIMAKTGRVDDKAWDWVENLKPEIREGLNVAGARFSDSSSTVPFLLPMDVQLKKATGAGFSGDEGFSFIKTMKKEIRGVGFTIYLILPLMIIGLIISLQKGFLFWRKGHGSKKLAHKVIAMVEEGKAEEALELCRKSSGSIASIFKSVLKRRNKKRQDAEDRVYEILLHESSALEKNVGTVNILAAAAPLMGLLGTVSGMVNLFGAITLHGTSDPKIMASGIAEALLSTKWGLLAAIPLLFVYNWLSNRSGEIVSDMEKYSTRLVNNIFGPPEVEPSKVLSESHSDGLTGK